MTRIEQLLLEIRAELDAQSALLRAHRPSRFAAWLSAQVARPDAIGALARRVRDDGYDAYMADPGPPNEAGESYYAVGEAHAEWCARRSGVR